MQQKMVIKKKNKALLLAWMRGSVPGAPQAVLEQPLLRPCAHLPPQQLLQCLPVFLEKRKKKERREQNTFANLKRLLQKKENADMLQKGARPGTRCRTARSAPCPACTPPGTRCRRTRGHGRPPTHTQNPASPSAVRRRCRGRGGRYQYLRAARSALCLPASRMQAAAAAWHCFSTAGSTSLSSGSAAGDAGLPTPPLARGTALLPRAARSIPRPEAASRPAPLL